MFVNRDRFEPGCAEFVADAISDGRIGFYTQRIHPASGAGRILYYECLAYMEGTDGRMYGAGEFVPALEARGVAPMLDRHMLKLVFDVLEAEPDLILGCNLSADNLADRRTWAPILEQIGRRLHLAPRLVLELTETRELQDLPSCAQMIAEVRNLGVSVALDDFGAGFASPNILQCIDFDIVKIDRTFVYDIRPSFDGRDSLQHIVGLASCFAHQIVVEGIETVMQAEAARKAGATHFQGYLFSAPIPYGGAIAARAEVHHP